MNIKTKTLFWFLLPSILIAISTASFCYFFTRNTVKQNIIDKLELAADELREHVHLLLHEKKGTVLDFSTDNFIRVYTEEITGKKAKEEYYTTLLNNHLVTNKKSLDPNIYEIFIVDFDGKVIASTNEESIRKDVSHEDYFKEVEFSSAYASGPHYEPQLNTIAIECSAVLSSKIGREAIGIIVNRIGIEPQEDREHAYTSSLHNADWDYSKIVAVQKTRIMDFSSDVFIKDCIEGITKREDRVQYYTDQLNTYLSIDKKPLDPDIVSVFVADLSGNVVGSSEFGLIGKDVSNEAFFSKTMKRGSCISDLLNYPGAKQNVFDIARLLLDTTGLDPIGVIVNRYKGSCLKRITRSGMSVEMNKRLKGLGDTDELYIVNSDRLMITESRFIDKAILNQVVDTEGVETAFNNGNGMIGIYPDYRGVPIIGVSRYYEEMDWVVLAEKDVSEAFAPIVQLRNIIIVMGIMGISVIVVVAILLSSGITKPIRKLIEGTKRIAGGNLERPIRISKRKDEIRELSESFNLMMNNLKESSNKNNQLFLQVKKGRDEWLKTFDAITDIITIHDKDFRILRANKAFFEKFKLRYEGLIDKECYEIFNGTDKHWYTGPLEKCLKSLKPEIEEIDAPDIGGSFLVSVYPLKDERENIFGFVYSAKDVTFQKKLQIQLIDKASKLEKVNKELEDFVYIVSHDLKEPLFSMEGFRSRLSRGYKDRLEEKGMSYLERMKVNIEVMSKKISEIMEVLKVGRVEYNFQNNDAMIIVKEVLKSLESKITESNVNIIYHDNIPAELLCDKEKLKHILSNLIINSIKFLGNDKQRKIKIGCDRDGNYYKFYVEDTGIGIQQEFQEQIFKIFRRLNDVEVEGTGVGLAIVKKIVEQHNGNVWVESPINDGSGSRFCFTIPVSRNLETIDA